MPNTKESSPFFLAVTAVVLFTLGGAIAGGVLLFGGRAAPGAARAVEPANGNPAPLLLARGASPLATAAAAREAPARPPTAAAPEAPARRPTTHQTATVHPADVKDADGLAELLDELEITARGNGEVTATEIEPGLAAIRTLYATNEDELQRHADEFVRRMAKVTESLASAPSPAN